MGQELIFTQNTLSRTHKKVGEGDDAFLSFRFESDAGIKDEQTRRRISSGRGVAQIPAKGCHVHDLDGD